MDSKSLEMLRKTGEEIQKDLDEIKNDAKDAAEKLKARFGGKSLGLVGKKIKDQLTDEEIGALVLGGTALSNALSDE